MVLKSIAICYAIFLNTLERDLDAFYGRVKSQIYKYTHIITKKYLVQSIVDHYRPNFKV